MVTVLDYSAAPIAAEKIKAAGHSGAVRYISPPREEWMKGKPVSRSEVDDFRAHGLDMAFVWQYGGAGNPDSMRGRDGGLKDATAADLRLKEIGCEGWPVFFAVDFNITLDQWNKTAVEYFKAACEVMGRDRVGIYGHSRVIAWAAEDGVVADLGGGTALGWQTPAWSNGQRAPEAVLFQGTGNVPGPAGVQVDVNTVLHSYWGQTKSADKPKENTMTKATIDDDAVDIDLHHLIGFGGPTALPKKVVIVHTTENAPGTSSRAILDYQVRTQTGSYHRLVDATGQITLANTDGWRTWSTGNKGNDIALHVSLVAQAKMTRAEWLAQPKMLEGTARVIAYWARTYDIPLVKLTREELGAGKHGVAGHLEAQVWGNTDHWDPGYEFPYDVVLARAKEINAGAKPEQPPAPKPATPAPAPTTPKETKHVTTLDDEVQSLVEGSTFKAPLGFFIRTADQQAWEAAQGVKRLEKQMAQVLDLLKSNGN